MLNTPEGIALRNHAMHRRHRYPLATVTLALLTLHGHWTHAQVPASTPVPEAGAITPTWETQKSARTYLLNVPPPRGQITDRNGVPLAQSRVGHSLCISFPTPLDWSDEKVVEYARTKLFAASRIMGRPLEISAKAVLAHYRNRGLLPFEVVQDVLPPERAALEKQPVDGLSLRAVYLRFYPNGSMLGQVLGYCGRTGKQLAAPIQTNDALWPDFEGREGIEKSFNSQLVGLPGQINLSYDPVRNQITETSSLPPQPGKNVITTIDEGMQRMAEELLSKRSEKGAIVVIDTNTGDLLTLASYPSYNPNDFVPFISTERFAELQSDPDVPLLPRAFRSAYPAGSTFKVFVGLAAFESNAIDADSSFECPPYFSIGNLTFKNWKKTDAGSLNFVEALTQSCNTWFYQVAIKTGGAPIVQWTKRLGLGQKTGIPIDGELPGRIPDDAYMRKVYNRPLMEGDLANMGIGQGDILISPIQMAQAMGVIGNGGIFYQTRLVKQVQSLDGKVVAAYGVRAKDRLYFSKGVLEQLREAMVGVVEDGNGTAAAARVDDVRVAGKTGTAQWGPKNKERTAAWFAGFAPAENPRYAFAAVYEGAPNDDDVHGGSHAAPLIGKLMKQVFERDAKIEKERKAAEEAAQKAKEAADEGAKKSEAPAEAKASE